MVQKWRRGASQVNESTVFKWGQSDMSLLMLVNFYPMLMVRLLDFVDISLVSHLIISLQFLFTT